MKLDLNNLTHLYISFNSESNLKLDSLLSLNALSSLNDNLHLPCFGNVLELYNL